MRKKYDRLGKEGLEEDEKNGGGGGGGRGGGWHDSRYYEREFGLYDEDEQIDTMTSQDFWPVTVSRTLRHNITRSGIFRDVSF